MDSLSLNRSPCFGYCPTYRLTIRANGLLTFEQGDSVFVDSIPPRDFGWLAERATASGFFKLPMVIAQDRRLCPIEATDHSTVTVVIYRRDSLTRVVDYLGCYSGNDLSVVAPVGQLRHFENQIDSVAHSARWIRNRFKER